MRPVRGSACPAHSFLLCCAAFTFAIASLAAQAPQHEPVKPGVTRPGVARAMADLHPSATFHAPGMPDWMAVTPNAVWVTSSRAGVVTELNAQTNQVGRTLSVAKGCSGLLYAFDSLWVPSCGDHVLVRANPATGETLARIPAGPADSEGGVTAGAGSVWLVTDANSTLTRIDTATNKVQTTIALPSGSSNPLFADGSVWVSSHAHDALVKVDPATNTVVATIPVGKGPRFLTSGAGAVWTLNQGDGTISRVNTKTGLVEATIDAGIPGEGGEIAFGSGAVWATVIGLPITRVDPATNQVTAQWKGIGGDSIRAGLGSLWLTDLFHGTIWRLPADLH